MIIRKIPLLFSLLAVASIAMIGVLGNTQSAYAGVNGITVDKLCIPAVQSAPGTITWEIWLNNTSSFEGFAYACSGDLAGDTISGILSAGVSFHDSFNSTGLDPDSYTNTINCIVSGQNQTSPFNVTASATCRVTGEATEVAGELLPLDNTALLLAGLNSIAIWMVPVITATGAGLYLVSNPYNRRNLKVLFGYYFDRLRKTD